jgi:predicted RNA binding protein YcfA (HicA-like mRNA interferase family)
MKVPRDLSAADLEKALHRAFGYQFVRQLGSHRRLTSQTGGLDICAAPRPSLQSALKARSIPAQGNTLGKPASLGSCALQGRRSQTELRVLLKRYEMAFDERYLWD